MKFDFFFFHYFLFARCDIESQHQQLQQKTVTSKESICIAEYCFCSKRIKKRVITQQNASLESILLTFAQQTRSNAQNNDDSRTRQFKDEIVETLCVCRSNEAHAVNCYFIKSKHVHRLFVCPISFAVQPMCTHQALNYSTWWRYCNFFFLSFWAPKKRKKRKVM